MVGSLAHGTASHPKARMSWHKGPAGGATASCPGPMLAERLTFGRGRGQRTLARLRPCAWRARPGSRRRHLEPARPRRHDLARPANPPLLLRDVHELVQHHRHDDHAADDDERPVVIELVALIAEQAEDRAEP